MKSLVNNARRGIEYRFNGKELDEETGLAYYGARYYDNQLSMWLSVDPLDVEYPSLTPYNFVANNPLEFVDPDGNEIVNADDCCGGGGYPWGSNPMSTVVHAFAQFFHAECGNPFYSHYSFSGSNIILIFS